MWFYIDAPWQYRILDSLPPGIDHAQLERNLAMTPTERLAAAQELMRIGDELARAVAAKASKA